MKRIAFQKASRRLQEAKSYLEQVRKAEQDIYTHEFQRAWSGFLQSLHSVPEILKTSVRSTPRERQWFGVKETNIMKRDPLLKYLKQARGCDYHGVESGAESREARGGRAEFYPNAAEVVVNGVSKPGGVLFFETEQNEETLTLVYKLVPVVNELHNTTFYPPTEHLGRPLPDDKPSTIAELAFDYYESLLAEAASFPLK